MQLTNPVAMISPLSAVLGNTLSTLHTIAGTQIGRATDIQQSLDQIRRRAGRPAAVPAVMERGGRITGIGGIPTRRIVLE